MDKKIRVLIVDDSALMRQILTEILNKDPGIEVVGVAMDAYVAREKIKQLNPDVLTLDVEMPRMDGVAFLRNLMRLRPMPVVMCSSLTEVGADVTLDALALGAIDFVTKPKVDVAHRIDEYAEELITKVKVAARAHVRPLVESDQGPVGGKLLVGGAAPAAVVLNTESTAAVAAKARDPGRRVIKTTEQIIAIGASTGGTEAIKDVLIGMPPDCPGIVVAQHIPKAFSGPFAARMNQQTPLRVFEASDDQQILPGHVYIAPGDQHLVVVRNGAQYRCRLDNGPPVNRHKPSVDVLFRSVAETCGGNAIGLMLTGMGKDGAQGMKEMLDAGAATLAQDENTSVVWGMPGAAWNIGAVESLHPLQQIAAQLMKLVRERSAGRGARAVGT
jgi:two-component system, chemotaxis family, protein-glutamate methylesterase/glutaminase